jgi:hypothetical protein
MPKANRHVARRDARLEGEPDPEPSALQATPREQANKDSQRDVTSLSTPIPDDDQDEDRA